MVKPEVNQTVQNPDEGSSHILMCTIILPTGVSPDLLQIEWSGHRSLMPNNPRVIVSNITKTTEAQQYTKIVTFQQVQPVDDGNYTCTVSISGFTTSSDVIIVNGEYPCSCIVLLFSYVHLIVVYIQTYYIQ